MRVYFCGKHKVVMDDALRVQVRVFFFGWVGNFLQLLWNLFVILQCSSRFRTITKHESNERV